MKAEKQKRAGNNNIEKSHYKFTYISPFSGRDVAVLLDVLFSENCYPSLVERKIENELLMAEGPDTIVRMPDIDSILGDKLTAFAPHTIGIPFGITKELEIMKQLFDCWLLFREMSDFNKVKQSYGRIAQAEIEYRGLSIKIKDALKDTIAACSCIIGRGSILAEDYKNYQKGLNAIRGHIYRGKYNGEYAALYACEVMYLAASILTEQASCPFISKPEQYIDETFPLKQYKKLSYIKRVKLEAYGYIVEAVKMLEY